MGCQEGHPVLRYSNDNQLQAELNKILSYGVASFKEESERIEVFGETLGAHTSQWSS